LVPDPAAAVPDSIRHRLLAQLVALDDLDERRRVVVGCSGGADSVALFALVTARGFDAIAVYVDHGLREGVVHEAAAVASIAERLGATSRREMIDVARGGNLEARARDARYAALERVRAETNAQAVLVGHTRDDQAETVLLNLLRGSGTAGLAGMPERRGYLRRPLLRLRRADTHELCRSIGVAPVSDPMNAEVHHRRVWLRREIIPQLERGANRDIVEVLARQAELLRDDNALLDALAAEHAADDVKVINALPAAVARRVIRQRLGAPPPSAETVERVLAVASGARVGTDLPGGGHVRRVGGRLVFAAPAHGNEQATAAVELRLPGRARFGALTVEAWIEHGPPAAWPDGKWTAVCDADAVGDRVTILPGGHAPVIEAGGPVWAVGYRIDRRVRVNTSTRRFLWLSAEPADT
jgi:tRNA(Ile)-lysidine synthase